MPAQAPPPPYLPRWSPMTYTDPLFPNVAPPSALSPAASPIDARITSEIVPVRPLVLVIDDSVTTARAMGRVLQAAGYDAVILLSHAAASKWLAAHQRTGQSVRPAAVLIDVHLPDGSGVDLSHAFRNIYQDTVPLYIISGDTSMATLRSLPEGPTRFVAKPFHAATLVHDIQSWTTPAA